MKKILFLSLAIFGFSAVFAQLKVTNAYGNDLTVAIGKQSKIVPKGTTATFENVRLQNVWLNCLTPEGETFAVAKKVPRSGQATILPTDNPGNKVDNNVVTTQQVEPEVAKTPSEAYMAPTIAPKEANYADGNQSLADILANGTAGTNTGLKPSEAPVVIGETVNTDPTTLDENAQVYLGGTQPQKEPTKIEVTPVKPQASAITVTKKMWLKSLVPGHQLIFEPEGGEAVYLTYSQSKKIDAPVGDFDLKISYVDLSSKTVKTVLIPKKVDRSDKTIQITPADLAGGTLVD